MKTNKKTGLLIAITTLVLLLSSCYTPSPLYGNWSDNDGNKISFMDDGSFNARIKDTDESFINYSGTYVVIDNIINFNIAEPITTRRVGEWDIRGAILYITFEGRDKALILYHTAR